MKKLVVLGGGISGYGSAILARRKGFDVFLSDSGRIADRYRMKLEAWGVPYEEGGHSEERILAASECVKSPGIPDSAPIVRKLRERGVPVISEIEFAGRYLDGARTICITGSNGKTTTTSLVYRILRDAGCNVALGGNIGESFAYSVATGRYDWYVLELSSFQLDGMFRFRADIGVLTNITPDHLDRHKTLENYIAIKESITKNQDENDFCVLNYNDPVLREFGKTPRCKVIFFSSSEKLESGVFLRGDTMIIKENGVETPVCTTKDTSLVGMHNYENIMAAIAMTHAMGVPLDTIRQGIKEFTAVEHRIEFVAEKNGVKYYNDSKGTNPDAAIKAVCAMPSPTILIGGGYDKKSSYDEWVATFEGRVKELLLIGKTKHDIAAACDRAGFKAYKFVDTLEEAVSIAAADAESGDCVLLSPACASWDMFKCYQQRGEIFKDCVRAL